jgi:ABC-2 type transport system permease protein
MSSFTNILKKELRELLTKSTILPIVMMALMFGLLGNAFSGIKEEVTAKPVIGVIDNDNGMMSDLVLGVFNSASKIQYNGTSVDEGIATLERIGGNALIVIPANFSENILNGHQASVEVYWILKGAGLSDTIPSGTIGAMLSSANSAISAYLIENNASLNASVVLAPATMTQTTLYNGREMVGLSPEKLQSVLAAQSSLVPIVIMMIIIMSGTTVISSMAMEKENKTLETLLTLPVSRSSVIAGKLVASAIVGLLMAAIYMVGFSYYMNSATISSGVNLAEYGLQLDALDYAMVGLSVFASLMAALSLCMVIGAFATDYKSSQSLVMPVVILAIVPMFILLAKDFGTLPLAGKAVMFSIPFSHPMMAIKLLMFNDYSLVLAGIGYCALFSVVMISIAVWLFKTDRLLTGRLGKKGSSRGKRPTLIDLLRR